MTFIFKTLLIVGSHHSRAGGSTRDKLLNFTNKSIEAKSKKHTFLYYWYLQIKLWLRLFFFEYTPFWVFNSVCGGWIEVKADSEKEVSWKNDGKTPDYCA